jgi:hypothetical protein
MSNDTAGRVLTIIGLVFNGLNFIIALAGLLLVGPVLALLGLDPLFDSLIMLVLAGVLADFLLALIVGLVLPLVGYAKIRPESKGTAGGILIASGVIGLIFISLIGGILLLIAGIVVAAWQPLAAGGYRPIPEKSLGPPPPFAAQPSIVPAAKFETPKGARYCPACGTELQGDEHFCPVCGTTIG